MSDSTVEADTAGESFARARGYLYWVSSGYSGNCDPIIASTVSLVVLPMR